MNNQTELKLDTHLLQKGRLVLRAINHPLRQQILHYFHSQLRVNVTSIYHHFQIEQSVASQQLAILRRQGFVNTERNKKQIFYSVNYDRVKEVQEYIRPMI